jgi:hypothetical protein
MNTPTNPSYAIIRRKDLKPVRIFPTEKEAHIYIRFDPSQQYQIERCLYQPTADRPHTLLVVFIDREDNKQWTQKELFKNKKMARIRNIKTQPRAIREYVFKTSRKRWLDYHNHRQQDETKNLAGLQDSITINTIITQP